jgi:hypothetical protein
MPRDTIEMQLTPAERSLLLRYGYPFAGIERALRACSAGKAIEIAPIERFELERLIGDLCYSINRLKPGALQNQLLELCDRLEAAERYGDGTLDPL